MSKEAATVRAAVAYANQLRLKGDIEAARDPYASPYRPTEASARKLCARKANEAVLELPADATPEQVEQARATGPARAIAYMAMRAKQHATDRAEQDEISHRAEQRLKRRQEQHRKHRDQERAHLSPGKRIDDAIARLSLVASPAAAKLGRDVGEDAEKDRTPAWSVDASSRARMIALRAVREIEALEDEMTTRDLRTAA